MLFWYYRRIATVKSEVTNMSDFPMLKNDRILRAARGEPVDKVCSHCGYGNIADRLDIRDISV